MSLIYDTIIQAGTSIFGSIHFVFLLLFLIVILLAFALRINTLLIVFLGLLLSVGFYIVDSAFLSIISIFILILSVMLGRLIIKIIF